MLEELKLKIDERPDFERILYNNNVNMNDVIKMYFDNIVELDNSVDLFIKYLVNEIEEFSRYNDLAIDDTEYYVKTHLLEYLYIEYIKLIRDLRGRKE